MALYFRQGWLSITLRRLEKSPSERYGLTKMSSSLLSRLLSKDHEEFNLHLSPYVENDLKLGVGIDIEQIGKKIFGNYLTCSARKLRKSPSLKPKSFLGRKDSMIRPFISFSARSLTLRDAPFEGFERYFGSGASKEAMIGFEVRLVTSQRKTSIAREEYFAKQC
jgi:hypothetical protein